MFGFTLGGTIKRGDVRFSLVRRDEDALWHRPLSHSRSVTEYSEWGTSTMEGRFCLGALL